MKNVLNIGKRLLTSFIIDYDVETCVEGRRYFIGRHVNYVGSRGRGIFVLFVSFALYFGVSSTTVPEEEIVKLFYRSFLLLNYKYEKELKGPFFRKFQFYLGELFL